jgi:hypothetical protein
VLDAKYFAATSKMVGSVYNLSFTSVALGETSYGFTADATNVLNPQIQINSYSAYPIVGEGNTPIKPGRIVAGKSYVVKYITSGSSNYFYFQGEYEICAITKLVSKTPSAAKIAYDLLNEPTANISYIVNPDSPFCSDYPDVGEIRQVLSGGEYENIYGEDLALQRAEYENWKSTDLLDTIELDMIFIPWLKVNQKIEYYSQSLGKAQVYLVKSISGSSSQDTMRVSCQKFQPLYPWLRT